MSSAMEAWQHAIDMFVEWSRSSRYPASTVTTRRQQLGLLAKGMPAGPWDVTGDMLRVWFGDLRVAANTYRSRRTTVRAFYAWAVNAGHVAASPAGDIPRGEVPRPDPRPVPDRDFRVAWLAADDRARLMLMLAEGHGMRRAEVAVVHSTDLFEDLDGWSLVVHGKGGRDRVLPLQPETAAALLALPPGYAFPGRMGGHLSPRWVGRIIADLLPSTHTMHKLRHRAATRWNDETSDLRLVAELLGHANLNTTAAYVLPNRKRMRAAVEGKKAA